MKRKCLAGHSHEGTRALHRFSVNRAASCGSARSPAVLIQRQLPRKRDSSTLHVRRARRSVPGVLQPFDAESAARDRAGGSSGIGRATALRFARAGASVLVVGRNQEALAEVAAGITEAGGRGAACVADVTAAMRRSDRRSGAVARRRARRARECGRHHRVGYGRDDDRPAVGHDDGYQRARAVPADARRRRSTDRLAGLDRERVERHRPAVVSQGSWRIASASRASIS